MAIIAPDINPQPIPGVRLQSSANETTFGGGPGLAENGQEIQKIAASTGDIGALELVHQQKIAQFEQEKADQTAVQDATAKLSAIHTDLLTNRESGLPAYQGVNALKGQSVLWDKYQKSANELSQGLTGYAQQTAFNVHALGMGETFLQNVKAHVSQELDKHDAKSFEALVNNKATESGTSYGNANALAMNNSMVNDATIARAKRLGLDPDETKNFMRTVKTGYHEDVLSQMVNDPNFIGKAKEYFDTYKSEMDSESKDRVRGWFDTIPKQQESSAKANQEKFYKANMRTAMLDMLDGKLTVSEAQRRYRENQLSESDYNSLNSKLSKPDAMIPNPMTRSDPETFNEIRQTQLAGSKSPGEIQRMIMKGVSSKDIGMEDGKYLMGVNSETPPTPRDKQIESYANNLRDFGSRYFAETNFFGMETDATKQKANQAAESLVSNFYQQADKTKSKGKDLEDLAVQIKKTAMQSRFPGLGNLDKAPDVVIDIKGKVTRLLSPDQRSGLKPKYKIVPSGEKDKEDQ